MTDLPNAYLYALSVPPFKFHRTLHRCQSLKSKSSKFLYGLSPVQATLNITPARTKWEFGLFRLHIQGKPSSVSGVLNWETIQTIWSAPRNTHILDRTFELLTPNSSLPFTKAFQNMINILRLLMKWHHLAKRIFSLKYYEDKKQLLS